MILNDRDIAEYLNAGRIGITPYDSDKIQPASYDVSASNRLVVFDPDGTTRELEYATYDIQPGQFLLGSTAEWIRLPPDLVGRLEGKSSMGRLGLTIHSTAGYIDPGFQGTLTLELSNLAPTPIRLQAGQPIGQISFHRMSGPAERPYGSPGLGSKYQNQTAPTPSRRKPRDAQNSC